MKVLILAGGFAKRLWPLTLDKSKALLPLAGQPVLSHILDKLPRAADVIVSTNQTFAESFQAWRTTHPDRNIQIFVEPTQSESDKTGALAAVGLAMRKFGTDHDWLVIGGDNFFTFSLAEFLSPNLKTARLVIYDIQDRDLAKRLGVVDMRGEVVTRFIEKPEIPPTTLIATGCFYFPVAVVPRVLEAAELTPDKLGSVFTYFLEQGVEVRGYRLSGYWNDIGTFDAYLHAHEQAGSVLTVPQVLRDRDLNNVFEGANHVDSNSAIINSRIRNSIILSGAVIENSSLDGCIVNQGAVVRGQERRNEIIHSEP